MATILLQAAGSALFGSFGAAGAAIGQAAGALAGAAIDRAFVSSSKTVEGRALSGARIPGADEGTGVNRVYGTMRIAGTLFWATRFEETVTSERQGAKLSGPKVETYRYFANFALGLCEGEIAGIRRVWADGRELDLTQVDLRVYKGTRDQAADPLIEAKQGTDNAPAYRGLAYVVFEGLPLDAFGNRIPVLHFEVIRPVGRLESDLRAITVIPGSTEHGYAPEVVTEETGPGQQRNINRNVLFAGSDWQASLDELQALCPNLESVALVVAWFGDDLRAGECRLVPGVETGSREAESAPWSVGGVSRAEARRVSRQDGGPAFGGTPDDASVVAAIRDLRDRGLKVFVYPFVLMDIPAGNTFPDPYGAANQPAYPWRGRITCDPAPGRPGSTDRTTDAATQVAAFCGPAQAGDFDVDGTSVDYSGSDSGYRRMILHYAHLAAAAGGVDGFIIGSELRGLTRLRDGGGAFPFVGELVDLARAARTVLGSGTALTYGADWSEYFGYHPADGTGDVFFNLDALWACDAIDAVGIDNYMPLSDWRDGDRIGGNPDGFRVETDPSGLAATITAGEGFDWFYASAEDRAGRVRSPITDGLAGKPWVYRYKDIEAWWTNPHFERVDGQEALDPTAWVPRSKPIWFTEIGCPAVDKGANQPNVFPDPKSSESAVPYFSTGARSDLAQRRFLEANLKHWSGPDAPADMVDSTRIFAWTWDARPYPAFPYQQDVWSDGPNWRTGHWLNGRLGTASAPDLIAAILEDHGFAVGSTEMAEGDVSGYVQSDPASARSLLEPVMRAMRIEAIESGAELRFQPHAGPAAAPVALGVLAERDKSAQSGTGRIEEVRAQESELASQAVVDYVDPANAYENAAARSRRLAGGNDRQKRLSLPAAMDEATAVRAADSWLRQEWAARRTVRFAISPADRTLEAGDAIGLPGGPRGRFVVTGIEDGAVREISAVGVGIDSREDAGQSIRNTTDDRAAAGFSAIVDYLDLPILKGADETAWARAGAFMRPWRPLALSASAASDGFERRLVLDTPARIGRLVSPLQPGVAARFDERTTVDIDLFYGGFASVGTTAVLNGANVLAVLSASGIWEVLQFCNAEEIAAGRWRLTRLLRGQAGTDDAMAAGASDGARVIAIDDAVRSLDLQPHEAGLALDWIAEPVGRVSERRPAVAFTGGVRALTPLSPVHLRARRAANDDITMTWIRRGRLDADSWLAAEIPLDEPEERYRVDVLDGGSTVRTVETATASWQYSAGLQTTDFGGLCRRFDVRVRQLGRKVADGAPAVAAFDL